MRAIARDLRDHYASSYQILSASSGDEAMDIAEALKLKNQPIALFLADQRMPAMTGVDFLEQASALHPKAKRALLTAYADKEAAIRAINAIHLDYYLMKPWDPPDRLRSIFPSLPAA